MPAPEPSPPPPPSLVPPHLTVHPKRVLGLWSAASVVVGAVIGTGIFFTPSAIARVTGDPTFALLSWTLAGAIAFCGAMVFAELGGRYHSSGAQYDVLRDSFGPLPAFLFVFCNATGTQACAIAIISIKCVAFLADAVNPSPYTRDPTWVAAMACSIILIIALMNILGVRWGARIQNLTVICKVATLIGITLIAAFVAPTVPPLAPAAPSLSAASTPAATPLAASGPWIGMILGLVPAFFSYGGWQQALWISGEVERPRRNVPRAIIIGMVLVIAVYLLVNWAYLHLLGVQRVADSRVLASDAVAVVYPNLGRRIVAGAVAISALGVLNSQLLSGPRLVFGMARDGRFFEVFGRLHPRFGTPTGAILLLAVPALALVIAVRSRDIEFLLNGAVFIDAVFFIMTGMSVFVLRRKFAHDPALPADQRPFRMPFFPLFPILFILGQLGGMIACVYQEELRNAAFIGVLLILFGVFLYFWRFRSRPGRP